MTKRMKKKGDIMKKKPRNKRKPFKLTIKEGKTGGYKDYTVYNQYNKPVHTFVSKTSAKEYIKLSNQANLLKKNSKVRIKKKKR